jgi:hypothetical protein
MRGQTELGTSKNARPYHLSQVIFLLRKAKQAETDLVMVAENYSLTELISDLSSIATGFQQELTQADENHIRTTRMNEMKKDPEMLAAFYAKLKMNLEPMTAHFDEQIKK